MSPVLHDPSIVDKISQDKGGTAILALSQPLPWDMPHVEEKFQERLNGCLEALTTGAIYDKYPDLKDKPARICIMCQHAPPDEIRLKLDELRQKLANLKVTVEVIQIPVETITKKRDSIIFTAFALIAVFMGLTTIYGFFSVPKPLIEHAIDVFVCSVAFVAGRFFPHVCKIQTSPFEAFFFGKVVRGMLILSVFWWTITAVRIILAGKTHDNLFEFASVTGMACFFASEERRRKPAKS